MFSSPHSIFLGVVGGYGLVNELEKWTIHFCRRLGIYFPSSGLCVIRLDCVSVWMTFFWMNLIVYYLNMERTIDWGFNYFLFCSFGVLFYIHFKCITLNFAFNNMNSFVTCLYYDFSTKNNYFIQFNFITSCPFSNNNNSVRDPWWLQSPDHRKNKPETSATTCSSFVQLLHESKPSKHSKVENLHYFGVRDRKLVFV